MSCQPSYVYRPTDRPIPSQSVAAVDDEHRSRLFIGGTFFRSIDQGIDENDISLEVILTPVGGMTDDITLNVRVLGVIQETFLTSQTFNVGPGTYSGGISALRGVVGDGVTVIPSDSDIIEMYPRGIYPAGDFFDVSGSDAADNGLGAFADTSMVGGSGPPSVPPQVFLDSIFTGPERTIVILSSTEDSLGASIFPPPSKRIRQYDGINFISYCNDVQGACPLEGTC